MKIKYLLSTIFLFLYLGDAISQLNISDYNNCFIESVNIEQRSEDCGRLSEAYLTKYGTQSYNIPNSSNPQYKTILVNFNIMQKNDGSGNFSSNANDVNNLSNIFNWMNGYYKNNQSPSDPIQGVEFIPDTYIRFELAGIYFYQNTTLWNSANSEQLLNMLQSNYPERMNQLNIFFTEGAYENASGFTNFLPSMTGYNLDQCIVTFNKYNNGNDIGYYACAGHLAHEMGHVLGLLHTYEPSCCHETCDESDRDYLDDVFGIDGNNNNCWHDVGWSCDPKSSNNTCTNNMMGGLQVAGYFSPKQIGRMNRSINIASTQRYIKEGTYNSNTPLEITENEYWDFSIRLYNDIIINQGATLTISCKLLMLVSITRYIKTILLIADME